jgi:hypothetical protein
MRGLLAPRCGRGFHSRGALMASQWGERPKPINKELFYFPQETPVRKASPAVLAYPYARCSCLVACVHDLPNLRASALEVGFNFGAAIFAARQQTKLALINKETKSKL